MEKLTQITLAWELFEQGVPRKSPQKNPVMPGNCWLTKEIWLFLPSMRGYRKSKHTSEKYQGRFGLSGGLSLLSDMLNVIDFQDRGFGGREFAIGY